MLTLLLPVVCGHDLLGVFARYNELRKRNTIRIFHAMFLDLVDEADNPVFELVEKITMVEHLEQAIAIFKGYSDTMQNRMNSTEAKKFVDKLLSASEAAVAYPLSTFDDFSRRLLAVHRSVCVDLPTSYNHLSEHAKQDLLSGYQLQRFLKLFRSSKRKSAHHHYGSALCPHKQESQFQTQT